MNCFQLLLSNSTCAATARVLHQRHGEAVQVEPIKLMLKAPGTKRTKRLELNYYNLLSSFAFKFNLRRYVMETAAMKCDPLSDCNGTCVGKALQVDPWNPC